MSASQQIFELCHLGGWLHTEKLSLSRSLSPPAFILRTIALKACMPVFKSVCGVGWGKSGLVTKSSLSYCSE